MTCSLFACPAGVACDLPPRRPGANEIRCDRGKQPPAPCFTQALIYPAVVLAARAFPRASAGAILPGAAPRRDARKFKRDKDLQRPGEVLLEDEEVRQVHVAVAVQVRAGAAGGPRVV